MFLQGVRTNLISRVSLIKFWLFPPRPLIFAPFGLNVHTYYTNTLKVEDSFVFQK